MYLHNRLSFIQKNYRFVTLFIKNRLESKSCELKRYHIDFPF